MLNLPGPMLPPSKVERQTCGRLRINSSGTTPRNCWIQQLRGVVPELLIRSRPQVCRSTLLGGSIGPGKFSIRLQKNPFAVTRRAYLGTRCRHVKHCRTALQEWWAKSYMLIPGNWPVINAEICRLLFAINGGTRAIH